MERRVVRTVCRVGAALGVVAGITIVPAVASASGGGGCGAPVTEEAGDQVVIEGWCFTPTVLRVGTGEVVTFRNADPTKHNVLGANGAWGGWDALKRHGEIAYRFTQSGVYPFLCTYHLGMIGAVVVGDGVGGAFDASTEAGPVVRVDVPAPELETMARAAIPPRGESKLDPRNDLGQWTVAGAGAFVLVAVGGAVAIRRHRRRSLA